MVVSSRRAITRQTISPRDLLDANEQQLFAGLSVFRGGCTLESAEAADPHAVVLKFKVPVPEFFLKSVLADGASGPTSVTYRGNPTGTTGGLIDIQANNTYTGPTYITNGRVATQGLAGITTPFGVGPNAIVYVDGTQDGQFFSSENTTIANPFVVVGNGLNENGTRSGVSS